MRIVKDLGVFRQTEEYEYTPTLAELFYYYSGTNAGYTRDNPYAPKHGATVTKRKLVLLKKGD